MTPSLAPGLFFQLFKSSLSPQIKEEGKEGEKREETTTQIQTQTQMHE
jgi:hypothetical protein